MAEEKFEVRNEVYRYCIGGAQSSQDKDVNIRLCNQQMESEYVLTAAFPSFTIIFFRISFRWLKNQDQKVKDRKCK